MLAMIPVLVGGAGVTSSSSSLLSTTNIEGLKHDAPDDDDLLQEGEGFLVEEVGASRFKAAVACSAARLALSREPEWSMLAAVGVFRSAGLEKEKELSAGDNGDMPLLLAEEYNGGAGLRVFGTAGVVNNGDSGS
jgi:hypothetical protein